MTVPATPRRAGPYNGDGSVTAFDFDFKVFDGADVRVVELDVPTGVETDAVLSADYTVALNPDQESTPGGTVNYLVAPSSTTKITIVGDLGYEQPTDLPDGGSYRAQQVENALDRLAILVQQLKETTDRCAQVPVSESDAAGLIASINALAANLATLQTLVANISDLVALANDIDDVALVAANMAAVLDAPLQAAAAAASALAAAASAASIALPIAIDSGGTGQTTASGARTALGTDDAANITSGNLAAARITNALNASGLPPLYAARAWVNFNGTGTVAIRGSGNVSSITDNGAGQYTVNFITAMPDANYAVGASCFGVTRGIMQVTAHAAGSVSVGTFAADTAVFTDSPNVDVVVFR